MIETDHPARNTHWLSSNEQYDWLRENCRETYHTLPDAYLNWNATGVTKSVRYKVVFTNPEDEVLFLLRWA